MDTIDRFIRYLEAELNLSPNTVAAYARDLRQWESFATGDGAREFRPDDVTASDLRTWLAAERRTECSARTLRRKTQSLRAFYRYLMTTEGLKSNPAADIDTARLPRPLPVFVRQSETGAMLDAMERDAADTDDFTSVRNALMVEMLYQTGMRSQELIDLEDDAVDTAASRMRVMGKRRKERIIPFGPRLAAMIDDYRARRARATGVSATDAFFVRPDGRPLYRRLVWSVVHTAMADAGVHASRMSPHVLRHSCATDMLNAGADLNSVRELLGHASLATTQVYTHLTYRDLLNNYQHAHPRAQSRKETNHGS